MQDKCKLYVEPIMYAHGYLSGVLAEAKRDVRRMQEEGEGGFVNVCLLTIVVCNMK